MREEDVAALQERLDDALGDALQSVASAHFPSEDYTIHHVRNDVIEWYGDLDAEEVEEVFSGAVAEWFFETGWEDAEIVGHQRYTIRGYEERFTVTYWVDEGAVYVAVDPDDGLVQPVLDAVLAVFEGDT